MGMATVGREEAWIVVRPTTVAVLVLDLALIVLVIAWGLTEHYIDPLDRPHHLARTAAPFLLGWLVMAPVAGAFSRNALTILRWTAVTAIAGWMGAALVGVAIRATPFVPGGADPIFVLVMVGVGTVVMVPWRLVAVIAGRRLGLGLD